MSENNTEVFESYGFQTNWNCPQCGKTHSKPHFEFPGQIDKKKKPNESGRIRKMFKRENDESGEKINCEQYVEKFGTGPATDPGNKKQAPLMCPHCGWCDELIYIERK